MKLMILVFSALLNISVIAVEPEKKEIDPFDLTAIQERIQQAGVPTPQIVEQLEAKASGLASESKWQEAADAYELLAKSANWLSNLITTGLSPFYSASYDDRKSYNIKDTDIKLEELGNKYKKMRNEAIVRQAECYIELNDNRQAVPLLVRSLELINLNEEALWTRARKALYSIIQVQE